MEKTVGRIGIINNDLFSDQFFFSVFRIPILPTVFSISVVQNSKFMVVTAVFLLSHTGGKITWTLSMQTNPIPVKKIFPLYFCSKSVRTALSVGRVFRSPPPEHKADY
jgi:hypothetical protein